MGLKAKKVIVDKWLDIYKKELALVGINQKGTKEEASAKILTELWCNLSTAVRTDKEVGSLVLQQTRVCCLEHARRQHLILKQCCDVGM